MNDNSYIQKLYLLEYKNLLSYAKQAVNKHDVAEELVHQTFLIAIEREDVVQSSSNPIGWLYNTLKHEILHFRRRCVRDCNRIFSMQSTNTSIEDTLILRSLLITSNIQQEQLSLLLERYYYSDSIEEIARRRDISVGACKMRIMRAKRMLQKEQNS